MPTGIGGDGGTSSSCSSHHSWAYDFIKVCLLRGSYIFIFGSLAILMLDSRIIRVSRQPNGRLALPSLPASRITPKIYLHRQNGKRRLRLKIRLLRLTTDHRLCWTIMANMRWGADKALILMVVVRSSPWGTAWKNSRRSSREWGMTTSLYGLPGIWRTGTPMNWLMI